MKEEINNLKNQGVSQIINATSLTELDDIKLSYLGRKGKLTILIQKIKDISSDEKRDVGILINIAKNTLYDEISKRKIEVAKEISPKSDWFKFAIPPTSKEREELLSVGHFHAQTIVLKEIKKIFSYLGYQITDGPEIETDYYNFEALNIPKDHPARDTQQTFYVDTKGSDIKFGELILRTQTSAMQGRVMKGIKPPFRVLVPGKNYRYEQVDASHGFEFWQVEGFVVDENIHLTDLFGTIEYVLKSLFGDKTELRFATTNFPFVEPGVDTYIKCTVCGGKGCSFCKRTGWSEIMPAGMIHPFVLKEAGIDTKKWGGFAFAIGLSRVVTLKYQISDLRTLTTPDVRILKQF